MIRTWKVVVAVVALAAGVAGVARADRTIDETVKADKDGVVSISNVAGSVTVTAWDRAEVSVTGTVEDGVEEVDIDVSGGDVDIEVRLPRRSGHNGAAYLTIQVPKGVELEISAVSADIDVSGVIGALELESVSGRVDVDGAGEGAEVSTVSGDITLSGDLPGVEAQSVSGDIEVSGASGEIEISTTSGDIEIEGADFDRVECESMSGRITFDGDLEKNAELAIEGFSGATVVTLPADLNATISVETHSGSIQSDFGDDRVRTEKYGPGAWLETEVGDGSAEIDISSFSGSVKLRKR